MVKIENENFKQALDFIRTKLEANQVDFNKQEKDCLKLCYDEIQKAIGSTKKLNLACNGCVLSGSRTVLNYTKFHEQNELKEEPIKAKVVKPRAKRKPKSK